MGRKGVLVGHSKELRFVPTGNSLTVLGRGLTGSALSSPTVSPSAWLSDHLSARHPNMSPIHSGFHAFVFTILSEITFLPLRQHIKKIIKSLPPVRESRVRSLGRKDPLQKEMV